MGSVFAEEGLEELVRTYRSAARERLTEDGPLRDACKSWASYVRASNGAIFESIEGDGQPADRVFVDALAFDFLVDSVLDAVEAETGVTLSNRDPRTNTDALPVAFGDLHDRVLPPADGRERVRDAVDRGDLRALDPGDLRALYERVLPREARLALGEFYTPRGVADLALDSLSVDLGGATVLDPGCGSGVFLVAAIDRKRELIEGRDPEEILDAVLTSVAGIDLNPVAVKSAKLAVCTAVFDLLAAIDRDAVAVPVFLTDALGLTRDDEIRYRGEALSLTVDALVGNPPWVPWERLPERVKTRWRDRYVDDLGLQPHEGAAALLGHSNDDVSIPYVWVCIHRYLRAGGQAGFVLKRDVMRGPAGVVLRRLQVGERSLALAHVHDLAGLEPFPDVGANAAVYAFTADAEASFPIETTVWQPGAGAPDFRSGERLRETARPRASGIVPLDAEDPTTAWIDAEAERAALGECTHTIRHGLKDDCNEVFDVPRETLGEVDGTLVYPYLQSRHVRAYGVTGHDLRLVPQRAAGEDNEAWLRETVPGTYEYLQNHRGQLGDRASTWLDRGPFYSVFGLGEYTWAPYKVVWCRLGFKPEFAVVSTRPDPDLGERLVVPGDHYMFVATHDERTAHFLCALLNSAPYQRTLRELSSGGKASLSKSVVSELSLPAWPGTATAERLAEQSRAAHDLVADGAAEDDPELAAIQAEIDGLVEAWLARRE